MRPLQHWNARTYLRGFVVRRPLTRPPDGLLTGRARLSLGRGTTAGALSCPGPGGAGWRHVKISLGIKISLTDAAVRLWQAKNGSGDGGCNRTGTASK
jgi:hypothetical protein